MEWNEFVWGLVGFLLTVMILSYLIGDNFFFRLVSSLFVGLTAGYLAVLVINRILGPNLWVPITSGSLTTRLWTLVPLVLIGLLVMSQFSQFAKLGTIPLAFLAGLVAALTIGGAVFGTLIPQTSAIIEGFNLQAWQREGGSLTQIGEALIMLLGTVTTLSYFHFGRRKISQPRQETNQRPKVIGILSKVGQAFIGITLGAIFAGVFSTALLALIYRIAFLGQFITQWIGGR